MKTTLIIARHGNTFTSDQTPTRVGKKTDLPLVEKGIEQAKLLGQSLLSKGFVIKEAYVSNLQRTQKTASLALHEMGQDLPLYHSDIFDEIDYGPDENEIEENVIARIGSKAIEDWDLRAVPPQGWIVNPAEIKNNWREFTDKLVIEHAGETILVVTSNGTARFAPEILPDYNDFLTNYNLKLSTGAYGVFTHDRGVWQCVDWNVKPR